MATLSIKNFPDELYEKVRELARRERRSIGKQVIHLLAQALEGEKTHSIMELCGLGKEIWEGIDPAEYIREERDSWES